MALQPAPDRPAFTVRLLMAVLGHDEFRLQRHHPVVLGRHDRRRHHRVEGLGPVLAALAGRAPLTPHFVRHMVFRAVQGDQHVAAKLAKILQAPSSSAITSAKTGWKWAGSTGSSSARTWLSLGILSRPNSV